MARGKYIAFCDDDDIWTRDDHLEVAIRAMTNNDADAFFADMRTVSKDTLEIKSFYGSFLGRTQNNAIKDEEQLFLTTKKELSSLLRHRTVHCNTIVLSKNLIARSGSYWEKICFAEDHDFCFRIFDTASRIVYRNISVSDLNVSPHESIARSYATIERSLFGIIACLHAETTIRDKHLRKALRDNQAWRFLELSKSSRERSEYSMSRQFCLRSLAISPSFSGFREFVIASAHAVTDFATAHVPVGRSRSASPTE